jgi:hypothetical protein
MAPSFNKTQPIRSSTRITRAFYASQLLVKETRVVAKASKVPPPSREMQLLILKHMAELLKMRKEIAIETIGKKGRVVMKELIEEHIKQFP